MEWILYLSFIFVPIVLIWLVIWAIDFKVRRGLLPGLVRDYNERGEKIKGKSSKSKVYVCDYLNCCLDK